MAAPSATASVLLNDDLLTTIFAYLDTQAISQVRLVSHTFEAAASPYLFSTLRLGVRKRYLRRLKRVAADDRFAKGVREIVWDTAHYATGDGKPYDEGAPGWLVERVRKIELARLHALAKDEEDLWEKVSLLDALEQAFRAFTGLKGVVITSWSSDRKFFKDSARIRCLSRTESAVQMHEMLLKAAVEANPHMRSTSSKVMPPPYRTLLDFGYSYQMQNRGFHALLEALAQADRSLVRLSIASNRHSKILGHAALDAGLGFPGMLLGLDDMTDDFLETVTKPLARLQELKLDLDDKDLRHNGPLLLHQAIGNGGLARFLAHLQEHLEVLDLRIHAAFTTRRESRTIIVPLSKVFGESMFRSLRKLALADFWLEPAELCEVLSKHASTLEEIKLVDINLGGTADAYGVAPGVVGLLLPEHRALRMRPPEKRPGWEAVVQTCQALPRLRRLSFETLSVGVQWEILGWYEVEDLVERGMNGRPNCLVPAGLAGFWEQLEADTEDGEHSAGDV